VSESLRESIYDNADFSHHSKIQDHDEAFYLQFAIIIAGLDSISARRWINATLVNMVDEENPESLKPLIDGGTEGERRVDSADDRVQGTESSDSSHRHCVLRVLSASRPESADQRLT